MNGRAAGSVTNATRALRSLASDHPFACTLLSAFVWLLLLRGVLLLHAGLWPDPVWMLLSDAVAAVALALVLPVLRPPWLRLALMLALGAAYYAAGQHMWAHGTIFRVAHWGNMSEPLFLWSSVLTWWLLLLPVYCLSAWVLYRLHLLSDRRRPAQPLRRLGIAAGCVAVYGLLVTSPTAPANNVMVSTLIQLPDLVTGLRGPPDRDEIEPVGRSIESRFFHHQIRGGSVEAPPNVLLVIIEGLSGAYLPSVAAYHGLSPAVSLPALEGRLQRRGFRIYRNVLGMQRQTNRGSFPMLCGAYARVGAGRPKMADIAAGDDGPDCVPEILRRGGYRTGYLQAAPLEFMDKDAFMPKAGFEHVHGAEYFEPPEDVQGWGPEDDVFFAGAAEWLLRLHGKDGPWFAATLNVGTHYPFTAGAAERRKPDEEVVDDALGSGDDPMIGAQRDRQAAFAVMAGELVDFLDTLAGAGVLDNTLVIMASDEAGDFVRRGEEPRLLDGNFGTLAVRPPEGQPLDQFAGRRALVATIDVALTVLDAAGMTDGDPAVREMIGRSLLAERRPGARGLLLGDTYAGYTIFLLESGDLLACGEGLVVCNSWRFVPQRPFGTLRQVSEPAFLDVATRTRLVERAAIINPSPSRRD